MFFNNGALINKVLTSSHIMDTPYGIYMIKYPILLIIFVGLVDRFLSISPLQKGFIASHKYMPVYRYDFKAKILTINNVFYSTRLFYWLFLLLVLWQVVVFSHFYGFGEFVKPIYEEVPKQLAINSAMEHDLLTSNHRVLRHLSPLSYLSNYVELGYSDFSIYQRYWTKYGPSFGAYFWVYPGYAATGVSDWAATMTQTMKPYLIRNFTKVWAWDHLLYERNPNKQGCNRFWWLVAHAPYCDWDNMKKGLHKVGSLPQYIKAGMFAPATKKEYVQNFQTGKLEYKRVPNPNSVAVSHNAVTMEQKRQLIRQFVQWKFKFVTLKFWWSISKFSNTGWQGIPCEIDFGVPSDGPEKVVRGLVIPQYDPTIIDIKFQGNHGSPFRPNYYYRELPFNTGNLFMQIKS